MEIRAFATFALGIAVIMIVALGFAYASQIKRQEAMINCLKTNHTAFECKTLINGM